jgi:hypothetical protein
MLLKWKCNPKLSNFVSFLSFLVFRYNGLVLVLLYFVQFEGWQCNWFNFDQSYLPPESWQRMDGCSSMKVFMHALESLLVWTTYPFLCSFIWIYIRMFLWRLFDWYVHWYAYIRNCMYWKLSRLFALKRNGFSWMCVYLKWSGGIYLGRMYEEFYICSGHFIVLVWMYWDSHQHYLIHNQSPWETSFIEEFLFICYRDCLEQCKSVGQIASSSVQI